MKRNFTYIPVLGALALMLTATSCTTEDASPGVEYMPDMYRSPAIEAYVDYGQDPFYVGEDVAQAQRETPSARKPVAGTIAFSADPAMAWMNYPYAYPNTPQGYEAAGAGLKSPIPYTEESLAQGKAIFNKFCDHCHGAEGKGDGKIVTNGNFPPVPAYDGVVGLNEGKMFHTLTYGKGNMGSHASQLDKLERWKVIQYVRTLQTGKTIKQLERLKKLDRMSEYEGKDGQIYFKDADGNYYGPTGRKLTEQQVKDLGMIARFINDFKDAFGKDNE